MYRSSSFATSSSKLFNARCRSVPTRSKHYLLKGTLSTKSSSRRLSSGSSKPAGNALYLGASVVTVGLLGAGVTAYVHYNEEFRKNVEESLPFTKNVFNALYGEIPKKETLLAEKDLSIPFQIPEEKMAFQSTDMPDPKPSAHGENHSSSDILAITTIDTPGVSMLDLTISNPPEVTMKDEDMSDQKSDKPSGQRESHSNSDVLAITTIDIPGISMLDLTLSNPPETTMKDEGTRSIIAEEAAQTDVDEVISEVEVSSSPTDLSLTTPITDISLSTDPKQAGLSEEGLLTKEEIGTLSGIVDQAALEVVLAVSVENLKLISGDAVQSQKEAAESLHAYMKLLSVALFLTKDDPSNGAAWEAAAAMESESQEIIDRAKTKESKLKLEIESVKELMHSVGKVGPSDLAEHTGEFIGKCKEEVSTAAKEIKEAEQELAFLLDYKNIVDKAPEKLRTDLKQFTPDLLTLLKKEAVDLKNLSTEDVLLALALRRPEIVMLQRDEEKILESKKVKELFEKQKEELVRLSEDKLALEVRRVETEKTLEQELKLKDMEQQHEKDMLSQLKRQASAHSEHLIDELASQAMKLSVKHKEELDSKMVEQHKLYQFELEKNVEQIHGIQSKISDVVAIEHRQRRAQELWIASQALNTALDESVSNGRTRTLIPEMFSILRLGGPNDVLEEIVQGVPQDAAYLGVVPERDLLQRFKNVKSVCKRVAMIGEEGGSLTSYILSYLKSILVFSRWYVKDIENEMDVDNLGTYEILAKAEYYVQQGDLEQAAKFMSQLKGVPRKMSSDWLKEVRLFLETKQSAQLLLAYAASLSVGME